MLHIKFDTTGKVVYAYQHKTEQNENDKELLAPVPIIPRIVCKRISLDDWYFEHRQKIDEVICAYTDALVEFLVINSHYSCKVNEHQLRRTLLCTLYQCSHNSFKNYPST